MLSPLFLNMIWPATFVMSELYTFWYLVIATIVIEMVFIRIMIKVSWGKAFLISLVGNLISGFIGTSVMGFGMLVWHLIVDWFTEGTFNLLNWIATFVLMLLGSVWIETKVVRAIFKVDERFISRALIIGNLSSYLFIAVDMFVIHDNLGFIHKRWA